MVAKDGFEAFFPHRFSYRKSSNAIDWFRDYLLMFLFPPMSIFFAAQFIGNPRTLPKADHFYLSFLF